MNVTFKLNGKAASVEAPARMTLADCLRHRAGATGTHVACEHGVCGSCTVLLDGQPVRSCLMFAVQAQGHQLRTVEGLAKNGQLHPLQQAFIDHHALQCGFCTPGFLMLAVSALERNPDIGDEELRECERQVHEMSTALLRNRRHQVQVLPPCRLQYLWP